MTPDAYAEYVQMYLCFRAGYNRLSHEALEANRCRWIQRPKGHYLEHLVLDVGPFNGRYFHNFINEDFVRRIKHLAASSHPGHMSKHVVLKYALQVCLRWR